MKRRHVLCLILLMTILGCSGPQDRLADKCRDSARIVVHDPIKYKAYLVEVMKIDQKNQQMIAKDISTGKISGQANTQQFILPFPYVPGYEITWQHNNLYGDGDMGPTETPRLNNKDIVYLGRIIATIHDFEVKKNHFGYDETLSCSNTHQEVYGIRRKIIDFTP